MKQIISLSKCLVRGVSFWRVRWHEAGRISRKSFSNRDSADGHAASLRSDSTTVRHRLAALPLPEKEQLELLRQLQHLDEALGEQRSVLAAKGAKRVVIRMGGGSEPAHRTRSCGLCSMRRRLKVPLASQ